MRRGRSWFAAEDLLSQLESVKQMWYNAGFQRNFAEKSVRDAFADRTSSVLAQLAVTSLHTCRTTCEIRLPVRGFRRLLVICLQGPARQSGKSETTRRRGRLRLLRLRRPTAARGFEGAYTLTVLSSVCVFVCGVDVCGLGNVWL